MPLCWCVHKLGQCFDRHCGDGGALQGCFADSCGPESGRHSESASWCVHTSILTSVMTLRQAFRQTSLDCQQAATAPLSARLCACDLPPALRCWPVLLYLQYAPDKAPYAVRLGNPYLITTDPRYACVMSWFVCTHPSAHLLTSAPHGSQRELAGLPALRRLDRPHINGAPTYSGYYPPHDFLPVVEGLPSASLQVTGLCCLVRGICAARSWSGLSAEEPGSEHFLPLSK